MIEIREATSDDVEAMADVNAAGWRVGYRGIVPDANLENLPVAMWRREMRAGFERPRGDSFTRVAELEGEFAGYCFVAAPGPDERTPSRRSELVALYVDPPKWGRGVGRALVDAGLARAAELGYEEMYLWTFEENARALRLYRAAGFEPNGARRPFPATGTPTIRLRRRLT